MRRALGEAVVGCGLEVGEREGKGVGRAEGLERLGTRVGDFVFITVGARVDKFDGGETGEGATVVSLAVGTAVGSAVGVVVEEGTTVVSLAVGTAVGSAVGVVVEEGATIVSLAVGTAVGSAVGVVVEEGTTVVSLAVGTAVGNSVGVTVPSANCIRIVDVTKNRHDVCHKNIMVRIACRWNIHGESRL